MDDAFVFYVFLLCIEFVVVVVVVVVVVKYIVVVVLKLFVVIMFGQLNLGISLVF